VIRFPADTQRHTIIGETGSGKTQAGMWHLSRRNFHQMPWLIYNWKNDESIDRIPGAFRIELNEIPGDRGIYITNPLPHEQDEVEEQMWEIWKRGNTGLFIDEGYMIPKNQKAFRAILTQGRSKRIPIITLSQRPVWMDRFVLTESEYHQIFHIGHEDDIKELRKFISDKTMPVKDPKTGERYTLAELMDEMPDYHSLYHDKGIRKLGRLGKVPSIEHIHATFARRLGQQRKVV
jgi:hypothetical protein